MALTLAHQVVEYGERIAVGVFTLTGLIMVFALVWRYQRTFVSAAGDEIAELRAEVTAEKRRCDRLERALRDAGIPIPP